MLDCEKDQPVHCMHCHGWYLRRDFRQNAHKCPSKPEEDDDKGKKRILSIASMGGLSKHPSRDPRLVCCFPLVFSLCNHSSSYLSLLPVIFPVNHIHLLVFGNQSSLSCYSLSSLTLIVYNLSHFFTALLVHCWWLCPHVSVFCVSLSLPTVFVSFAAPSAFC